MKKYAATVAAALLALLGLTALAPSAQAYPLPGFYLTVNHKTVHSLQKFTATAHAQVNCTKITVSWNGTTATGTGPTIKHVFRAPLVTSKVVIRAKATCTFLQNSGIVGNAISAKSVTLTRYQPVTVLPATSGAGNGKLPNTGGPSIGWLIGGIAALLAGAGAMFAGRRRSAGAVSS